MQGATQGGPTNSAEGKEREEVLPPPLTTRAFTLPSVKWVIGRVTENYYQVSNMVPGTYRLLDKH